MGGIAVLRPKYEKWLAWALLAVILSVALRTLVGGSGIRDFAAGLLLGIGLALDVAYLLASRGN